MSGGSMDYLCYKIEEAARQIPDREIKKMAMDFADLMHDCEWYIDSDIGEDTWNTSLAKFKSKWFGKRDERLKEIIESAVAELRTELLTMIGTKEESNANPR